VGESDHSKIPPLFEPQAELVEWIRAICNPDWQQSRATFTPRTPTRLNQQLKPSLKTVFGKLPTREV
jgi:hypothetical protein